MKSLIGMFIANAKEFLRDRTGLFWTFAFPIVFICLFGLIFSSGEHAVGLDYVLPGILAMALMQLGLFGALQFVGLRESKIIRGLSLTPLSRSALLGSEILLRLVSAALQAIMVLAIGVLVFRLDLIRGVWALLPLIFMGALTFVSLGYLLSCFADTVDGATGIAQIVQLPMMFLSGIFFPVDMMPSFMQPIVRLLPLTYLAEGLREVAVGIAAPHSMGFNWMILTVWLVGTLAVTLKVWRWE